MAKIYLLTGGNLGNRLANLENARQYIAQYAGAITKASLVYETEAWGITDQPLFLNQALEIQTELDPFLLLKELLTIEFSLGRKRLLKSGPRTIDIDILLYDNLVIETETLTIPHPEIQNRRFALVPLCEIAANVSHPLLHKNMRQLLQGCTDPLKVHAL